MTASPVVAHRATFRAVVEAVVPESADLAPGDWERVETIVVDALDDRSPAVRRQLGLLLRVVDLLPLLRWGRRFRTLGVERRRRLLEGLQDASLLLLRRGVWGLRTLAFMGYYGRPEVYPEIGYRAHPRGWSARADVR